jgi:hypothetical protein
MRAPVRHTRQPRVVLHDMPQMLRQLVVEILRDADVDLVAEDIDVEGLRGTVAESGVDVVISHLETEGPSTAESVLLERPRVRVLALSGTGRTGEIFELRPQRTPLGELSEATLLAAIRGGLP